MKSVRNARVMIIMGAALSPLALAAVLVVQAKPGSSGGPTVPAAFPIEGPFHYKVEYLGITCGHMTLESDMEEFEGRSAYHVIMTARNSKFFNKIYRVDGRIDSWVDAETMSTLAYESDITEKGRRKIRRYRIDYDKGVVTADKYGEVTTAPYDGEPALDPLAYVFRGRMLVGKPGSTFDLNLLTDRGVIATESRVGELEPFKTADGRVELLRVQPLTADGEMFSRKGEFVYWVEPGAERKLYRLDFKLGFGRLHAKYTGPAEGPVDRRVDDEGERDHEGALSED
jgi:hypothetical protein